MTTQDPNAALEAEIAQAVTIHRNTSLAPLLVYWSDDKGTRAIQGTREYVRAELDKCWGDGRLEALTKIAAAARDVVKFTKPPWDTDVDRGDATMALEEAVQAFDRLFQPKPDIKIVPS